MLKPIALEKSKTSLKAREEVLEKRENEVQLKEKELKIQSLNLEDRAEKVEIENCEIREKLSMKIAPETVKDMEKEIADLRVKMQMFGEEKE